MHRYENQNIAELRAEPPGREQVYNTLSTTNPRATLPQEFLGCCLRTKERWWCLGKYWNKDISFQS